MCRKTKQSGSACNMEDLKKRLTRSLSGPRRCSYCQKMVYFSVAKCKECGDVMHKHCIYHDNHRNDVSKSTPIKDSEGTGNPLKADSSNWCSKDHWESAKNRTMSDSSYGCDETRQDVLRHHSSNVAMTGLLRIVRWLSHKKKTKEYNYKNNASALEKHEKGRFGLNPKMEDKEARKKLKALLKSTQNYQRFVYNPPQSSHQTQVKPFQKVRCASARSATATASSNRCQRRLCRSFAIKTNDSNTTSPHSSVSSYNEVMSPFGTPQSNRNGNNSSINDQVFLRKSPAAVRKIETPSISTNNSDNVTSPSELYSVKPVLLPGCSGWTFGERILVDPANGKTPSYENCGATNMRFVKRPFGKAKTLSLESHNCSNDSLCATWPPVGKGGTIIEEDSEEEQTITEENVKNNLSTASQRNEENIREWCIPFTDIEFEERIRNGRQCDIFRGRWYGDVLIYIMRQSSGEELRQFLEDVAQMGMIRHENIVLFMGACIEPPKLAVITSMRKGPTLYEYVHLKRNRLPFNSKLNIARQISQGMGYLHAKGITHRKLNSKNIILESRVKLCMMDYGMTDQKLDRTNCGCISRGQLSYISPELMRSLKISPPRIHPSVPYTQQSDIFAFGSLLFELLAERFAFHDQHPHAIIWKVATGKRNSLENFRFISGLKSLIRRCWSQNPTSRPVFSEVVSVLQENVSHHRRHSSSVPDKLQYAGHSLRRSICT